MILSTTLLIILIIILFFLSALFSGVETAFISLESIKAENLYKHSKSGRYVKKILSNKRKFLITVLIGNNVVNIILTILTTLLFIRIFGGIGPAVATGVLTFCLLTFGEIIPKTYATVNNTLIVRLISIPFYYFQVLLGPVSYFFEKMTQLLFFSQSRAVKTFFGDEELETALNIGVRQNRFRRDEREMILNFLKIDDITVKEIMTPLCEVVSFEKNKLIEDVMHDLDDTYSRVLIYDGSLNNPLGFVHVKELLVLHDEHSRKKISTLKRDLLFVSEHLVVGDALREMLQKNVHIAVINNRKGAAIGIVTQEDVFEEFLGEIYDETDDDTEDYDSSPSILSSPEKHYLINGSFLISSLDKIFDLKIPYKSKETVSMLIKKRIKGKLEEGMSVKVNNLTLEIHSLNRNLAIRKVRIIKRH